MNKRDRYLQDRSDRMSQAFNGGHVNHNIKKDDDWQMPLWVWALMGVFFAVVILYQLPEIGA